MDTNTKTKIIDSLVYIKSNIGLEEYADKLIKAVQEEHEYYQDNFRTKKYKVEWCRTYYCYGSIEVEALSEDEAEEKAMARSDEWEGGSMQGGDEDEITGVTELT